MDFFSTPSNTAPLQGEELQLCKFESDDAVVAGAGSRRNTPKQSAGPAPTSLVAFRRKSACRKSLYLNDIYSFKRSSLAGSSLMSSLTLTDYEGSFFTDAFDSKSHLSGWHEEEAEHADEDEILPVRRGASVELGVVDRLSATFSCTATSCDEKPTPPVRRESVASSIASTVLSRSSRKQPLHQDLPTCSKEMKQHSLHCKMSENSDQDHHPVKPGRRGSLASTTTVQEIL